MGFTQRTGDCSLMEQALSEYSVTDVLMSAEQRHLK